MSAPDQDDQVTPQTVAKPAVSSSSIIEGRVMATPQSVIDELRVNRPPNPSGMSPRADELIRRKMETEARFRSLIENIQKDVPRAPTDPKEQVSNQIQKQEKKRKSKHTSRKGMKDPEERRSSRQRDDVRESSRNEGQKAAHPHQYEMDEARRSPPERGSLKNEETDWGIKSVLSEDADQWIHFDISESDFSDSNSERAASFAADPQVESILNASPQPMFKSKESSSEVEDKELREQKTLERYHPSLRKLVMMDNDGFEACIVDSKVPSFRTKTPSIEGQTSRRRPRRQRSKSGRSESTTGSIPPTPSVIAAGVEELAAQFGTAKVVEKQRPKGENGPSALDSPKEKGAVDYLKDDDSLELRRKAARSANRRSRVEMRRRQMRFTPEGIELVTDDEETMSTISYDSVLDFLAVAKSRPGGSQAPARTGENTSKRSVEDRRKLLIEAAEYVRQIKIVQKAKIESSRSLADVLEASGEEELADDDPSRNSSTPQNSSTSRSANVASGSDILSTRVTKRSLMPSKDEEMPDPIILRSDIDRSGPDSTKQELRQQEIHRKFPPILRNRLFLIFCVVVLLAIVIVSVVLATRPSGGDTRQYSQDEIYNIIMEASYVDEEELQQSDSACARALSWVKKTSNREVITNRDRLIQRYALANLYYATNGGDWTDSGDWMTDQDECMWFSSSPEVCDDNGNLISLSLRADQLRGELPLDIALLTGIQTLDLSGNILYGTLPYSIQDLSSLRVLMLDENEYDGLLPSILFQLTGLEVLSVALNFFSGSIPRSLGDLKKLQILSLSANRLESGLPQEVAALEELRELRLDFNQLSGPIRSELGMLRKLEIITLDVNSFSQSIPSELGLLINLKTFTCNDCSLLGQIPTELGFLGKLEILELRSNQLAGTLPRQLGSGSNLRLVDLSYNGIGSTMPGEIGRLVDIMSLDLSHNLLSGTIPTELSSIHSRSLIILLDGNQMTGSVPKEVCGMLVMNNGVMIIDQGQVQPCECEICNG